MHHHHHCGKHMEKETRRENSNNPTTEYEKAQKMKVKNNTDCNAKYTSMKWERMETKKGRKLDKSMMFAHTRTSITN